MKWMKLAFLAGLSLSLWGTTTAQAAKRTVLPKYPRQRLFTFKTQRTKAYSYPRAAYARSKVLGVNKSTKKQWTVDKVVTVNGNRCITARLPHCLLSAISWREDTWPCDNYAVTQ